MAPAYGSFGLIRAAVFALCQVHQLSFQQVAAQGRNPVCEDDALDVVVFVLMVGEIRDPETAEIAVHAALTGHMVLSTLHTNDAPAAAIRMVDLGIPSYLLSSCLVGVLAQRLVRKLCMDCRKPIDMTEADIKRLGLRSDLIGRRVYDPGGCEKCLQTGYLGRTGVFELMNVNEELASQVARSDDSRILRQAARQQGMRTLMEDAARKVVQGQISREEAFRVTKAI